MRSDHHVRPANRGGLHDAVHDAGHKHTVLETGEEETAAVLVPEPAVVQRLDVHGHGVPGRVAVPVHVGQVQRRNTHLPTPFPRARCVFITAPPGTPDREGG